ncbi:MAG: hypothetical protein IKO52_11955 [Clostridia bacterium]|nr:hypothetical protein [Clostridia bacterium]
MPDMEELDKVVGGEESRQESIYQRGRQRDLPVKLADDQEGALKDLMAPEQIQASLNAAMENMNPIKGPVKK